MIGVQCQCPVQSLYVDVQSLCHYAKSLSSCNGGSLPVCKVAVIVQRLSVHIRESLSVYIRESLSVYISESLYIRESLSVYTMCIVS